MSNRTRTESAETMWKAVCSFLHYSGENRSRLTSAQFDELYALADGFGRCTPAQLREINGGYDWSHVRDSSEAGVERMYRRIQELFPEPKAEPEQSVGAFRFVDGSVEGPAEFMAEAGERLLARAEAGQSAVVNYAVDSGVPPVKAILVALQTEYAGWLGMKRFETLRK